MNGGKMLEVVKVVRDLDHNFFLKKAYLTAVGTPETILSKA